MPGTAGGPTLAIIGHIDEIGVHVSHIDDDGYLRFGEVGGWDPVVLVGQRVRIATRDGSVIGVIGRKPIHLLKDDGPQEGPEIKDLHIDIGAKDGDEARELVRIGDVGVIDGEPVELPNDRLVSRSLDNRIGCYVAAEAARLVAEAGGAPGDVIALAVVQEETTFAGSRTSAFALEPDVAIVVDVTFATDQPGIELGPITKHTLGSGPVIARGTLLHPLIVELLYETAEQEEIPFTVESLGRATGTDADAIHASPRRCADRARLGPDPLHALAGRAGLAVGHRRRGEADRGVRPAPRAGHVVRALSGAAAAAVRHRRDAARGRHGRASRRAARGAARGTRDRRREPDAADLAGRPDRRRDRARDPAAGGRLGAADRRARRRRARAVLPRVRRALSPVARRPGAARGRGAAGAAIGRETTSGWRW